MLEAPTSYTIKNEWRNIKVIIRKAASEAVGVRRQFRRRKYLKVPVLSEEVREAVTEK